MIEALRVLPFSFWIVIILIGVGFYWSVRNIVMGIGIPVAMVLATVTFWYVGDVLYNDYTNNHKNLFSPEILTNAWWLVALFLVFFLLLTPALHRWFNGDLLRQSSQVFFIFKNGVENPRFQRTLTTLFYAVAGVWILLLLGAPFRFKDHFLNYLFPFLGEHPGPWITIGLAQGKDTLLALANYLQIMVGALFGVIGALSTNPRIRCLALLGVFLTWPFYILDRTRKSILAIVVPGVLAWIFLRLRGKIIVQLAILTVLLVGINAWFGFIISKRAELTITTALSQEGFVFLDSSKEQHQGVNMFEELCWITTIVQNGSYSPNLGYNYFANLMNPIPRVLWPGKPTIGLDYAIARGLGGGDSEAGVYATLSNGLIGQGIINFGSFAGPIFAALLMSLWVCWLARLDLTGHQIGHLPLFGLGLIITLSIGRDITFLEIYPFAFGYTICWWLNRNYPYHQYISNTGRKLKRKIAQHQPQKKS